MFAKHNEQVKLICKRYITFLSEKFRSEICGSGNSSPAVNSKEQGKRKRLFFFILFGCIDISDTVDSNIFSSQIT